MCGYHDQGYFSRIFKKHTGKSPLEYKDEGEMPADQLINFPGIYKQKSHFTTSGYALFPKHPASEMTFYILFHNFIHIQFMKSSRRRNISRPLHDLTSVLPRKYRKYLIKLQTPLAM